MLDRVARSTGYVSDYTIQRSEQARKESEEIMAEWRKAIENGDFSKDTERSYVERIIAVNDRWVNDYVTHALSQDAANQ